MRSELLASPPQRATIVSRRCGYALVLLLSHVTWAGAQPGWSGVITDVPGRPAFDPLELCFAGDDAGNAFALWRERQTTSGAQPLWIARFNAATDSWGAAVDVSQRGRAASLDVNARGDATAAWVDDATSGIYTTSYRAATDSWTPPAALPSATGLTSAPAVVVDALGNATVIWRSNVNTLTQLRSAHYTSATGTWTAALDLTPLEEQRSYVPHKAGIDASGRVTVAWTRWDLGARTIALYTARWSPGATAWPAPTKLAEVAGFPNGSPDGIRTPTLAVGATGDALAVWPEVSAGGATTTVKWAVQTAATGAWSSARTFSTGDHSAMAVVMDGQGDATAVWLRQGAPGAAAIQTSTYAASVSTWTAPQTIASGFVAFALPEGGGLPLDVDDSGTATLVWRADTTSGQGLTRASRRERGQPWAPPVTLAERSLNGATGLVVASQAGEVAVLLSNLTSTRWTLTGASAPAAPSGLTLRAGTDIFGFSRPGDPLVISWSRPQTGLPPTGYRIEAGTSPTSSDVAVVDVGPVEQLGATLPAIPFIYVRVRALNGATASPPSGTEFVSVYYLCGPTPPAPSRLSADVAGDQVTLSWNDSGQADSFILEAGTASGLANLVSTRIFGRIAGSGKEYVAAAPPGTYYVRLRGVFQRNAPAPCPTSAPSNEVVVRVGNAIPPGAPTWLTPLVTGSTVSLSWSAGTGGAPSEYTLTARTSAGGAPIATLPMRLTSASFSNVPSGTYYLTLTASNAAGTSPPSAQITLTVP